MDKKQGLLKVISHINLLANRISRDRNDSVDIAPLDYNEFLGLSFENESEAPTNGKDGVGIASVEQTTTSSSDGGTNFITVTLTNGTSKTFAIKNGTKGSTGPAGKDGTNGTNGMNGKDGATGNGIASTVLNADYTLTLKFTDGTSYTTSSLRGATGEKGDKGDKGDTGAAGTNGTNGTNGTDGKSITGISLVKDASGEIVSGVATLSDNSTINIDITTTTETGA